MILVAGATGHLGTELVSLLRSGGVRVRVLTRDPDHARTLLGDSIEFAKGDVRDPRSLEQSLDGVNSVVSAITGFGPGGLGPRVVDLDGNTNLIRAAEAAGAARFVLLSMHGAVANHPMLLARMKHRAEEVLRASRLDWTIVRPTVFMELWAGLVGDPLVKSGRTTIVGRGANPINFISVRDLARVVALALTESGFSRQAVDIGGPENITFRQLVHLFELHLGRKASIRHVPLPVMRLAGGLLGALKPDLGGMIEAGIVMDTTNMKFDPTELRMGLPQIGLTRMAEVVEARLRSLLPDSAALLQGRPTHLSGRQ